MTAGEIKDILRDTTEQMRELVRELKVPRCYVYIVDHSDVEPATLCIPLGTDLDPDSSQSAVPSNPQSSLPSRAESIKTGGSSESKRSILAPEYMVFPMGSLSKPIIALEICYIIGDPTHQKKHYPAKYGRIGWDSYAHDVLNNLREAHGKGKVRPLLPGVKIQSLIDHTALPAMASYLFGYGGKFMVSSDSFLDDSSAIIQEIRKKSPAGGYSNCNYYLLLIILKEFYQTDSAIKVFEQHALVTRKKLKLEKTTFRKGDVEGLMENEFVPCGHEIPPNSTEPRILGEIEYMEDDMESVLFGGRTCAADYGKIIKEIMHAAWPRKVDTEPSLLPQAACQALLGRPPDQTGISRSYFGLFGSLNSDLPGQESVNMCSRQMSKEYYALGTLDIPETIETDRSSLREKGKQIFRKDKGEKVVQKEATVHYKAGMINGYTAAVYIVYQARIAVMAFTNGIGVLDAGEYCCEMVLQKLLRLQDPADIPHRALNQDRGPAKEYYEKIDRHPDEAQIPDPKLDSFIGTYNHRFSDQCIQITEDGKLIKYGSNGRVDTVQVRVEGDGLRVFPTTIDRWTHFKDVVFKVGEGEIYVDRGSATERYAKTSNRAGSYTRTL